MSKKRNWNKIGEILAKTKELGFSFKDGTKRFGTKPWMLYDYNKKSKKTEHQTKQAADTETSLKVPVDSTDPAQQRTVGLPGDITDLICSCITGLGLRRRNPS